MANANLALEINPSLASTIYDVTNNATLTGANLDITGDYGIYPVGASFTFLTTSVGTVNGMFNPPVFPP